MGTVSPALSPAVFGATEEEIRDEVAAALVDQGYSPKKAKAASLAARGNCFSDLFKSGLDFIRQSYSTPSVMLSRPIERETMKFETPAADEVRFCPGYKRTCGEPLAKMNRSGLCKKCYGNKQYHDRGKNQRAAARNSKSSKRSKSSSPAPKVVDVGRYVLEVTEEQLDRFLTKLPIVDKQMLANYYLANS